MPLQRKDAIAISACFILFAAASAIGWVVFGPVTLIGSLSVMFGAFIFLLVAIFRKIQVWLRHSFAQTEALVSLLNYLDVVAPLPPSRGWAVSPDFAAILVSVIREHQPKLIVEAGSGLSTLISAYTLRKNGGGHVISLDHDESFAAATARSVSAHGLGDIASVAFAPLQHTAIGEKDWLWYDTKALENVKSIDLLVVDGPPAQQRRMARYPALPILASRLSDNAIIVLDDASRPDEQRMVTRWLKEFGGFSVRHVNTEKGTVILQRQTTPKGG